MLTETSKRETTKKYITAYQFERQLEKQNSLTFWPTSQTLTKRFDDDGFVASIFAFDPSKADVATQKPFITYALDELQVWRDKLFCTHRKIISSPIHTGISVSKQYELWSQVMFLQSRHLISNHIKKHKWLAMIQNNSLDDV